MLSRLKAVLAQHPLTGFFALAGAAYVVSVWVMAAGSPLWLNHFHQLTVIVLGLVALTCCWATSGPRDQPPQRVTQLFIVVSATTLVMMVSLLRPWIFSLWARSHFPGGYPYSLGQLVHRDLSNTWFWLGAVVVGLVLAGVASPFSDVRRTSRALVAWRGPRVWRLIVAALVVTVCCIAFAWAGVRFVTPNGGSIPAYFRSAPYVGATFASALLTYVPLVFAWYGFVGRRLLWRRAQLVTGILIGLGLNLPGQLAFVVADHSFPWQRLTALSIAGDVALAVLGIWLARRARGSLLPTTVLFAAYFAGPSIAAWTSSSASRETDAYQLFLVGFMIAAALLVVAERMWRPPKVAAASPPIEESRPPTDHPFALTP